MLGFNLDVTWFSNCHGLDPVVVQIKNYLQSECTNNLMLMENQHQLELTGCTKMCTEKIANLNLPAISKKPTLY